jgi:hypothetical protein
LGAAGNGRPFASRAQPLAVPVRGSSIVATAKKRMRMDQIRIRQCAGGARMTARRLRVWMVALVLAACATNPPPAPPTPAQTQQLAQLKKALDTGVITRDQYDAQKKKILGAK